MARKTSELLYGLHTVRHSLESSSTDVLEVFVQSDKQTSAELDAIIKLVQSAGLKIQQVSRKTLDKQTSNGVHQGIAIRQKRTASQEPSLVEILETEKKLLLLVLDGIQDPHNLGACLRSANAAGVDAVILTKDRSVSVTSIVSKVASGAAEATPIITVTNLARTLRSLQDAGVWLVGTASEAKQSIFDVDMCASTAIVMGNEGQGLRENTRSHCDHLVNLPMHGIVDSLNVSVATGICLYEVLRQRRVQS